jgi:hypothetical protein
MGTFITGLGRILGTASGEFVKGFAWGAGFFVAYKLVF